METDGKSHSHFLSLFLAQIHFLTNSPTHMCTCANRALKECGVAYLTLQCLIALITPAEIFDKHSFITSRTVLPLSSHNMAAADTNCLEESHSHYHI